MPKEHSNEFKHYLHTIVQCTAFFMAVKITTLRVFLIFAQNINCGYMYLFKTASMRQFCQYMVKENEKK